MIGGELSARILGLVGYGAIAREVAICARALGMRIAAYDPLLAADDPAFRASSFFEAKGSPPGVGQLFLVFDPRRFNPDFDRAVAELLEHVLDQPGTRLPGARRLERRDQSRRAGIALPAALIADLRRRAEPVFRPR